MKQLLVTIARRALVTALLLSPCHGAAAAGSQHPLSAPELLASAEQMLVASGTVHETLVARIVVPGVSVETDHVHADFSYRDHWQHIFTRMHVVSQAPGRVVSSHSELVGVGDTAALRGVDEGGRTVPWTCLPHTTLDYDPTIFLRHMTTVRSLGAATLGGVPVWHLRLTPSRSDREESQAAAVLDLAIARSDGRIVQLSQHVVSTDPTSPREVTVSASLSRYGQPMNAELPAACHIGQP